MPGEFDLIQQYFVRPTPGLALGPGDDCALLDLPAGHSLATSIDTLIQDRHFFADTDPRGLGHKALAVSLSDLAAMGATPMACLLSLGIHRPDESWLQAFASGFHELADQAGCPLAGGDTVRTPAGVIISVTVYGHVQKAQALRRDTARAGDDIWLTGNLGAPDMALRILDGRLPSMGRQLSEVRPLLERPQPPWQFATLLAGMAHAAIDISDGLLQDLTHVLRGSHCGACLEYESLPVHSAVRQLDADTQRSAVLEGGDVYQLCFTAAPDVRSCIVALAEQTHTAVTRIGHITADQALVVQKAGQTMATPGHGGYDHFRNPSSQASS